jgi:hypothetical protein
MSGRSSILICAAAITALLVSLTCTEVQATTRTKDCLATPNASSPWGQHWYYRIDLSNHHKCWYLRPTITRRSANTSGLAAPNAAATPVPATSGDTALRLPHTRLLSLKPKLTSSESAKPIGRSDPHFAREGNSPPTRTLPDESEKADVAAASSPASAKSIQQSDTPSKESMQGDRSATTDMALASAPGAAPSPGLAKSIQESDAPVPEKGAKG